MEEVERVTTVSRDEPARVTETTRKVGAPPAHGEHPQQAYDKKKTIFRTYQVIWYVVGLIEVLLVFRVVLRMLGANVGSPFVALIYTITAPLALPFSGIFRTMEITNQAYFEWSTLVGMVVYLMIAYALVHFMQIMKPTTPQEVDRKVENV